MMVALSAWNDRIAPLFDVAATLHLVRYENGRVMEESEERMQECGAAEKAWRLANRGVSLLICGAISRPTRELIEAYGIRVIPFVTGPQAEVIDALASGRLPAVHGAAMRHGAGMGRGAGRRGGGRVDRSWPEGRFPMKEQEPAGGGPGRVPGEGTGQRERGGPGSQRRRGPGGACVCPSCGHEEPHQQGVPCTRTRCPQCGQALIRR